MVSDVPKTFNSPKGKKFVVAPLAFAIANTVFPVVASAEGGHKTLEEVTVTATRRALDIQDVPQSIKAFSTDDIQKMSIKGMDDYVNALPSVALTQDSPGVNSIVMRGISTGSYEYYTDSQVAVYLDDISMTAASQQVGVRTVDMERIEALPGPQGTLFGASSQTGTLRLITNKPSHEEFSGSIEGSYGFTEGGDDSHDINGHINVPLIDDVLSMRAVLYTSHDGGYIDNVAGESYNGNNTSYGSVDFDTFNNNQLAEKNHNEHDTVGGRIAFKWDMNEDWSSLFQVVAEDNESDGTWHSDDALGDYKITRFVPEWREEDWYSAALTVKGDVGFAELSVAVAHFDRSVEYHIDGTQYQMWVDAYYGLGANYYGTPYGLNKMSDFKPAFTFNDQEQERDSIEIRLSSTGDSKLSWIAGLYYEDTNDTWAWGRGVKDYTDTTAWSYAQFYATYRSTPGTYYYNPNQSPTLTPNGAIYEEEFDRTTKQTAAFSEVTYEITDDISVMGGIRWAEYDREEYSYWGFPKGLIIKGDPGDGYLRSDSKEDDTVFKVGINYTISDDNMVYALYSEGFRLGGENSPRSVDYGLVDSGYGTDTLKNYEIGMKSQWWDNRIQVNAQVFHMIFEDYQIHFFPSWPDPWWAHGTINGSDAVTTGLELDVIMQATDNLKISFNVFAADAEFDGDFMAGNDQIKDGDPMPGSPDSKAWLSLYYDIPDVLGGNAWVYYDVAYQGGTWSAVSDVAESHENSYGARQEGYAPAYTYSTFSLGLELPNDLSLTFNIQNLFDETGYDYVASGNNFYSDYFGGDERFRNTKVLESPRTFWLTARQEF